MPVGAFALSGRPFPLPRLAGPRAARARLAVGLAGGLGLVLAATSVVIDSSPGAVASVGFLLGLSVVIASVFVAQWSHRVYANIAALVSQPARSSAGLAALSWFVPLVGLQWPFAFLAEAWRASDPDAYRRSWFDAQQLGRAAPLLRGARGADPVTPLVRWQWAWLLTFVAPFVPLVVIPAGVPSVVGGGIAIALFGLGIAVSARFAMRAMSELSTRQDLRIAPRLHGWAAPVDPAPER